MPEVKCKHCGKTIAEILDPWGGAHGWHHVEATDNSDGVYQTWCKSGDDEAEPDALQMMLAAAHSVYLVNNSRLIDFEYAEHVRIEARDAIAGEIQRTREALERLKK
jgi:hypothetical protein